MFFRCFCRFLEKIVCLMGIAAAVWLTISWADVLMHNDPITGDAAYWWGNAIVMLINLTE